MRILVTLTFLLIAVNTVTGIWSCNAAYLGLLPGLPSHRNMLGFVNTTIEEIEKFDRALCRTHGGSATYSNRKKSEENFKECQASLKEEVIGALMMVSDAPIQTAEGIFFHEHCRMIPSFGNCLKNFTESMKPCLDVEKHESADIIYNTVTSLLEFICEDNSQASITKFRSFLRCVGFKYPALAQCTNQTFSKYVQATVSNGAAVGGLGAVHLLVPDVNKCTVLENFQLCTVEVLADCTRSMSTVDVANSLFNIVKKVTTCDQLLKSNTSPSRDVNIALITAATAMSLRFIYK